MACACQGKGKAKMNYLYTSPTGAKKSYGTEIEAQAAKVRNNGGSYRPVPR